MPTGLAFAGTGQGGQSGKAFCRASVDDMEESDDEQEKQQESDDEQEKEDVDYEQEEQQESDDQQESESEDEQATIAPIASNNRRRKRKDRVKADFRKFSSDHKLSYEGLIPNAVLKRLVQATQIEVQEVKRREKMIGKVHTNSAWNKDDVNIRRMQQSAYLLLKDSLEQFLSTMYKHANKISVQVANKKTLNAKVFKAVLELILDVSENKLDVPE